MVDRFDGRGRAGWCAGSDAPRQAECSAGRPGRRRPVVGRPGTGADGYAPPSCATRSRSPLWRNAAFVRVWSAATISIFGSLITRMALPLVAILVLGSGALEVAVLRSLELGATLRGRPGRGRLGRSAAAAAGAHLGRPRAGGAARLDPGRVRARRPDLLAAPGSCPGWRPILTTFFDSADNAYLPTIVERERLVDANGGAGGQRLGRRVHGLRDQRLPRPAADGADRDRRRRRLVRRLGAAARHDPRSARRRRRPRRTASRCSTRSATGLRLVIHDPVLRAFAGAQMALAALWGVFGATWFLFVLDELELGPAVLGVVAGRRWASRRSSGRSSRRAPRGAGGSGRWRSGRCSWPPSATRSSRSRRPACRSSRSAASSCSSSSPTRR